jgi:hypothetical protein
MKDDNREKTNNLETPVKFESEKDRINKNITYSNQKVGKNSKIEMKVRSYRKE